MKLHKFWLQFSLFALLLTVFNHGLWNLQRREEIKRKAANGESGDIPGSINLKIPGFSRLIS